MGNDEKPRNEDGTFKPAEDNKSPKEPQYTEEGAKDLAAFVEASIGPLPEEKKKEGEKATEKPEVEKGKEKAAPNPGQRRPKTAAAAAPVPRPAPLTADQIAEAAARGVASAMKPADATADKKDEPKETLSPKELRRAAILERMETLYPDECKGYAQKFRHNIKTLADYKAKWEKENPGQEFDEEGDEHSEFFEKNELFEFWDADQYAEALADMRADDKVKTATKATEGKLTDIERRERLREAEPDIHRAKGEAVTLFANRIGEQFPGLLKEDGTIDSDALVHLRDDYSEAFNVMNDMNFEVGVIYRAMNGLQPFIEKEPVKTINGKHNPLHDEWMAQNSIGDFVAVKEADLLGKPREERLNQHGQEFIDSVRYWKMPEAQRAKYWTFAMNDIIALRVKDSAAKARESIAKENAKFRRFAEKHNVKLPDSALKRTQPPAAESEETDESGDDKPDSPTLGGVSRVAARRTPPAKAEETHLDTFINRAI